MGKLNRTWLTGYRSIEEALRDGAGIRRLLVAGQSDRVSGFMRSARSLGLPVEQMSRKELRQVAGEGARDCALEIEADRPAIGSDDDDSALSLRKGGRLAIADLLAPASQTVSLLLLLDHITDPHNYGAILRSADQFQVDGVIVPDRRAAAITPVVQQSSAGAASHVRIAVVGNLAAAIERVQEADYWVYGAEMSGRRADAMDLTGRTALVLGAEGAGLSRLARERSDALVRIPAAGRADSFNVSVAAGILLYEVRRQQGWFDSA